LRPLRQVGPWFGLLAGGLLSCSLLVGGEAEPLRCSLEGWVGPPACDAGLACQGGVCRPFSAQGGASGGDGAGGSAD
jgi:hypothetical protein